MSLFVVDESLCDRDAYCVENCPRLIIEMADERSVPVPVPGADELCIDCGHCVAVCPHDALSHRAMAPEDCPPFQPDLHVGPDQAEHFLRSRRSIRSYANEPVDRDTLERLIKIASHAPSGRNTQPVHWLVVADPKKVQTVAGLVVDWMREVSVADPEAAKASRMDRLIDSWDAGDDVICRGAPHLVVAHAPGEDRFAASSCTIALTYLDIAAPALGLGSCWAGYVHAAATMYPPVLEAMSLPEGHAVHGAMMVGFAETPYHRLPTRKPPRIAWH
jgi:nitroreductase/NAD-dependent dihydropyrimidine dehydrogenase PreA subunit